MREHRSRLIFLNDTSTNTKMTKTCGRCLKGERLHAKAPFGHWGTQTLIAGLKGNGLVAPWVINAHMNRMIFDWTYPEKVEGSLVLGCHFSLESDGRFITQLNDVGMDCRSRRCNGQVLNWLGILLHKMLSK